MRFEWRWLAVAGIVLAAGPVRADMMTADRAVQIALEHNSDVINAQAGVLDARSRLYSSYSSILPSVSASLSRGGSRSTGINGNSAFGGFVTPSTRRDEEGYSTTPTLSGNWPVLNLAGLQSVSSARSAIRASNYTNTSTRQQVAFATRQQFYQVVTAIRLADVATSSLRLSRDDERRVRALFEVGSVSRSDLLKAQVSSAQGQLDSLRAAQAVTNQRIALARILGIAEAEMGEVDTTLTVSPVQVDEAALRAEAASSRPDLKAADADARAATLSLRAAQLSRLPVLSVSGSMDFNPKSSFTQTVFEKSVVSGADSNVTVSGSSSTDRDWRASIALTMPIFNGMLNESRIASAQAAARRAQDRRDALWRNLDAEVHQAVLQYSQAQSQDAVAREAVLSAEENLKLTQQKYNVGSSTILDLIDAQVQLQRAQSDAVLALAAMRVAEAQINRVRGRSE